jgi:hypothetical protein
VIINYCAALHFVMTTSATDDLYPVLLNVTDNASALSWTTGACKISKVGHLLARFFCLLMINSPLGINSKWTRTDNNKIADDISRIKRESVTEDSPPFFDYSTLTQTYPELIHCSSFVIQPELILLVWEMVLTERWPCHDEIRKLRQKLLRIALHFRAAARAVRPNISKDNEQRYSAHSMRVWACVLLDEAGKSPDYIKKRLRWMGDSFRMYLCDTQVIQDQHREALRASSKEVMDLISALPADILLSIMSEETAGKEEDMGVYQDDMD